MRLKGIILMILLTSSGMASAMHFQNCQIVEVVAAGVINTHVRLDCAISPLPSCATAGLWFAIDRSTTSGAQYLSLVMMAFSSGMRVTGYVVQSEGSCPVWQNNVALLQSIRIVK